MPSHHALMFLLLFCGLIWYVRDFIAALALLFLIYQWMIEDNSATKFESIPDRLKRMMYPPNDRNGAGHNEYSHRPLLYESNNQGPRRRYTESDIRLPPELLTPDEPESDSLYPDTLRGLLNNESRARHSLAAPAQAFQPPVKQRRISSAGRQRGDTHIPMDGVYHAFRAESMDELPPLEGDDSLYYTEYEREEPAEYDEEDDYNTDDDEFFLATDFADPLPKSDYTQSVDYLDDIMNEDRLAEQHNEQSAKRRCLSAYDMRELGRQDQYLAAAGGGLQKDLSSSEESADVESLPPESHHGSSADDLCPSPPLSPLELSTPRSRSHSYLPHSAREPREYWYKDALPPTLSAESRSKSETYLLNRARSMSSTMLAEEVDLEDIENHESFRDSMRQILGLHRSTENNAIDTSLEFRSPHRKTHEQLHHRLRRVLSSVSNSEENILEEEVYTTPPQPHYKRKEHWRTKSMPSGVTEFMESINSTNDFDERSKSVEVLNHKRGNSAFRLYSQEENLHKSGKSSNSGVFGAEDPTQGWMSVTEDLTYSSDMYDNTDTSLLDVFDITDHTQSDVFDSVEGDERFIDSPAVVDYQLGRRQDLPRRDEPEVDSPDMSIEDDFPPPPADLLKSTPTQSPANTHHITHPLNSVHHSDTDDDEIRQTLGPKNTQQMPPLSDSIDHGIVRAQPVTIGTPVVHATPIILGTPIQAVRHHVVHATPVMLGTPCELGERQELKLFSGDQDSSAAASEDISQPDHMCVETRLQGDNSPPHLGNSMTHTQESDYLSVMGPKRFTTSSVTPKSRLPIKAITPYGTGHSDNPTTSSPHDSLSSSDKGTRYFLRLSPVTTTPTKTRSLTSPTKSSLAKARPAISKHTPTKPKPIVATPSSRSRQVKRRSSPTDTKTRIPAPLLNKKPADLSPKHGQIKPPLSGFRTRSVSPKVIGGFRTRSVSPKVLKRNNSKNSEDKTAQDMLIVADKCNVLLQSLTSKDNSQSENLLDFHSRSDQGDNSHANHETTPVEWANNAKSIDNTMNNTRAEVESESEGIVHTAHSFIDPTSFNLNNTVVERATSDADRDIRPPEYLNKHGSINNDREALLTHSCSSQPFNHSTTTTTALHRSPPQQFVTEAEVQPSLSSTQSGSGKLAFHSQLRCQEPDLSNEDDKATLEDSVETSMVNNEQRSSETYNEAERDPYTRPLDYCEEPGEVERGVTVSVVERRQDRQPADSSQSPPEVENSPSPPPAAHPEQACQNKPANMSASWMDRLKETAVKPGLKLYGPTDLDNDDEWMSDEEEFQREQEEKLRRAAQQRALAQQEDLTDSDEDIHPPPATRPPPALKRQDSDIPSEKFEQELYSSDEHLSEEEHQHHQHQQHHQHYTHHQREPSYSDEEEDAGFTYQRNALNRRTLSRDYEYSSGEEEEMAAAAAAAAASREPDHNEMDLMVKKNLVYVNSNELDEMDILTTDLDRPAHELTVEPGVGEILYTESGADDSLYSPPQSAESQHTEYEGFDAKEDDDYLPDTEVSGTLEVLSDDIQVERRPDINTQWAETLQQYMDVREEDSLSDSESIDSQPKDTAKTELVAALVEDLRHTEPEVRVSPQHLEPEIEEDQLVPNSLGVHSTVPDTQIAADDTEVNVTESDLARNDTDPLVVMDYNTECIRRGQGSMKRNWMKQLSERVNEWEDELPQPGDNRRRDNEAVTSFVGDEDEADRKELERRVNETELKEKMEDSMSDKIRDWRNMTAESVSGQVDEWQSLGNFNVPPQNVAKRPSHDDVVDGDLPAEKRRDIKHPKAMREDSGHYDDINQMITAQTSYDGDVDEEDRGAYSDGEGYASDSSSQDTVRERSLLQKSGSVSEDDPPAASDAPAGEAEPGYVEILGGEEPPDEWQNIGSQRDRVDSISSSSSDGSGFQYIPAMNTSSAPLHEPEMSDEDDMDADLPSLSNRGRMDTPPRDATPPMREATPPPVEHEVIMAHYSDRQEAGVESPHLVNEPMIADDMVQNKLYVEDQDDEVLTEEEDVETVGEQLERDNSPAPPKQLDDDRHHESPLSDSDAYVDMSSQRRSPPAASPQPADEQKPAKALTPETAFETLPEPVKAQKGKDPYDRVEKLREEMRSAGKSSQSFDVAVTRPSRNTERFAERMQSQEKLKAMREKRTPTPTGLGGKFSSVFNKFASPDERAKRSESPLTRVKTLSSRKDSVSSTKSDGSDRPMRSATPRSDNGSVSAQSTVEPIKPTQVVKAQSASTESQPEQRSKSRSRYDPPKEAPIEKPSMEEESSEPPRESRAKRRTVERSKTFDTGVPSRASPASSKIMERMAKFGQSYTEGPKKSHQTVTTKDPETERFQRHTHKNADSQPAFDVDIQIRREPGSGSGVGGGKTAAITVGRDQVQIEEIDRLGQECRDEYMNVWDTEVPVVDGREKVLTPKRLHVTQINRDIKPTQQQEKITPSKSKKVQSANYSRARSEPRSRAMSQPDEEVTITVRPSHDIPIKINRLPQPETQDQARQRSSIALNPKSEIIPGNSGKNHSSRDPRRERPTYERTQSSSPSRPYTSPERDHPLDKGDSLDELRTGQLVAQTKGLFNRQESNPDRYLVPQSQSKAYAVRKPEPFVKAQTGSEHSWAHPNRRQDLRDAARDLADVYDQSEANIDYSVGYSRESLEYTREWVENNDNAPPAMSQKQHEEERQPDPRDDAAFRRMGKNNKANGSKHFTTPSHITMSSGSPEPSVISERSRGRSYAEPDNRRRPGRPKGRSKSLPRKPAKAIMDRVSVFNQEAEEPIIRHDIVIPSESKPRYNGHAERRSPQDRPASGRVGRSESPKNTSSNKQKWKLAARKSMPASNELVNGEQASPRAASKGVAMMIELYNKHKGESPLPDVDEQTLASLDDEMFKRGKSLPTSPAAVDETPLSNKAWKTWLGNGDTRSALEQKIENVYNKHTHQHGAPPIKRDNKPVINSGWNQRSVHEEPMIRPSSQSHVHSQPMSPPRPAKSDQARQAVQRGWSESPPGPSVPQRGYEEDIQQPFKDNYNSYPEHAAFDSYKQQSLQRFRHEEQYATVQRPRMGSTEDRIQPQTAHTFDQALLIQAPPPKPERLYNQAEPWEAFPPNDYPTTNALMNRRPGYNTAPRPQQYRDPNGYPPQSRSQYPAEPRPQYDSRYPNERPPPQQPQYNGYPQNPTSQQRESVNGYATQPRRSEPARYPGEPGYPPHQQHYRGDPGHRQPPKPQYQPQQNYDAPPPQRRQNGYNGYPDHVDSATLPAHRPDPRRSAGEPRYPHEQPPRGPIPDPRYSNAILSPGAAPQQSDPRYGGHDPRMEPQFGGRPRRTNSVPNMKHMQAKMQHQHREREPQYDPRYDPQPRGYPDPRSESTHTGSLPRQQKQKNRPRQDDLPQFIPIQYATGKYQQQHQRQPSYPTSDKGGPAYPADYHKQHLNNNYPTTANRYNQQYPPQNGHPPQNKGYTNGYHNGYPHADPYSHQRPGVGVMFDPDRGISDF